MASYYIKLIDHWQTLMGALVGAMGAFLVWMIAEFFQRKSDREERLQYLIKVVGIQAMIVADSYKAIYDFIDKKVHPLINETDKYLDSTSSFLGVAFFPIMSFQSLSTELLNVHTGSGYIDAKFLQIVKRSREFSDIIEDIKRQFEFLVNSNREFILLNKRSPQEQNKQFKGELSRYVEVVREEIIERNIPMYVKEIAQLQVALGELERLSLWRWRLKYNSSFKYFRSRQEIDLFRKNTEERIGASLKDKFQQRLQIINTAFIPELKFDKKT